MKTTAHNTAIAMIVLPSALFVSRSLIRQPSYYPAGKLARQHCRNNV